MCVCVTIAQKGEYTPRNGLNREFLQVARGGLEDLRRLLPVKTERQPFDMFGTCVWVARQAATCCLYRFPSQMVPKHFQEGVLKSVPHTDYNFEGTVRQTVNIFLLLFLAVNFSQRILSRDRENTQICEIIFQLYANFKAGFKPYQWNFCLNLPKIPIL